MHTLAPGSNFLITESFIKMRIHKHCHPVRVTQHGAAFLGINEYA